MIDERQEPVVHVPRHPIQLTFGSRDESVDRDLHLQLELSHRPILVALR